MTQHTPGPWLQTSGVLVASAEGRCIADCGIMQAVGYPLDVAEVNAKLIAAAPTLLDAAKKAFDALEAFGLSDGLTHGLNVAQCLLESAIAETKL